jgi:deazaflavin-dependent oxidoreductase (nitroreductase family)
MLIREVAGCLRQKGADMPIPRAVGRWNKAGLNRLTRHIAPWMPGLGVVVHRGRRSGRRYQAPVSVFPAGGGYLFALTYGPDTDWVKNVLAAGGCELRTRGRALQLGSPRLFHDDSRSGIRPLERQVLRILGVAASCPSRPHPARERTRQNGTRSESLGITVAANLVAAARTRCCR